MVDGDEFNELANVTSHVGTLREQLGWREPNGAFAKGNALSPGSEKIRLGHRLKKRFKDCVDENHPTLMAETVAEVARIAKEGSRDADKLVAIHMLWDRYWGKAPLNAKDSAALARLDPRVINIIMQLVGDDMDKRIEAARLLDQLDIARTEGPAHALADGNAQNPA
jgi:hypothetical protein